MAATAYNPKGSVTRTLVLRDTLYFTRADGRDGLKQRRAGEKVKVLWTPYLGSGSAHIREMGEDWTSTIPAKKGGELFKGWPVEWMDWREEREENPAVSGEQYRLAQAVLSGTAQETRMTKKVAREIVEKTSAGMRSEYMRNARSWSHNPDDSPRNWPVFTTFPDTAAGAKEAKALALKLKINGVLNRCELEGGQTQEWVVRVQVLQKGKAWGVIEGRRTGNPSDSEAKALEIGNDPKKLRARLQEARSILVSPGSFGKGTFDFARKRLVSEDGSTALQWRVRRHPDQPESYENQQTNKGGVYLTDARKRNPEDSAASMFESFHGEPSEEVLEFAEEEHYHSNLAALGVLVEMRVTTLSGYEAEICFEEGGGAGAENPAWLSSIFGPSSSKASDRLGPERRTRAKARARGSARSSAHSSALKTVSYRGHHIEETEDGFTIPEIDSSVFDTLKDAKEFVAYYKIGARARNSRYDLDAPRVSVKAVGTSKEAATVKTKLLNGGLRYVWTMQESGRWLVVVPVLDASIAHQILGGRTGPLSGAERRHNPSYGEIGYYKQVPYSEKHPSGAVYHKIRSIHGMTESEAWDAAEAEANKMGHNVFLVGGSHPISVAPHRGRRSNPSSVPAITMLCSNEAGTQLYLVGGDQSLDLKALHMSGDKWEKDSMVIGDVTHICYHARKVFGGKAEEFDYEHEFSEDDDGPLPQLRYDKKSEKLHLDGGSYVINSPLLGTSPGIEN